MCYPVTSCASDLGRTVYSITTCQKNFVRYQSSRACNSASTERIWMKKVSYWSQKVGESENATDISSKLKLYLSLQSLLTVAPIIDHRYTHRPTVLLWLLLLQGPCCQLQSEDCRWEIRRSCDGCKYLLSWCALGPVYGVLSARVSHLECPFLDL